jgi:hypothetical protein
VKSLIEEQKYRVAMASLTELIKLQLSSDQEKIVDTLKEKRQSTLAKSAAARSQL